MTGADRISDESAIRRVLAANEQAITDNDVERFTGTFTDDARAQFWDRAVVGRAAIGDYFRRQQGVETLRDVLVNLVIDIAGDEAHAEGSGLVIRTRQSPPQLLATSAVRSTLRRGVDGEWRISQQEKEADPSFVPGVGTLTDVVEALAARVTSLEERLAAP